MTDAQPSTRPTCPFCRAPWTDAMLAEFDRYTSPSSCACCAGPEAADAAHDHDLPIATEDLCCASCGRAIYLAPAAAIGGAGSR